MLRAIHYQPRMAYSMSVGRPELKLSGRLFEHVRPSVKAYIGSKPNHAGPEAPEGAREEVSGKIGCHNINLVF